MDKPIIQVNSVHKSFDKKKVLSDINLDIQKGKIYGLLGPSGAGKTTLVKIIAGIDQATKGEVTIHGEAMPKPSLMKEFGYMAQSDALYQDLTAKENLNFFGSLYGIKRKELKERIREVLQIVNLTADINEFVKNFSGGMKRRLSLAIALLHSPKLLILDEPTVGIDPVLRRSLWEEFTSLKNNGTTLLITTHVMDEAEHCDQLALLRDGHIIAEGSPVKLKEETASSTIEDAFLFYGDKEEQK